MMGVRKMLDHIFEKGELKILDDILPEFKRKEKLDYEEEREKEVSLMEPVSRGKLLLVEGMSLYL